jgi:hypothetical protein
MSKKNSFKSNRDFQQLAELVDLKLTQNNYKKLSFKEKDASQEKQVNLVFKLESSFKSSLQTNAPEKLADVYQKFMDYIKNDVGNILVSQSYFREKKKSFLKISSCIKNDNVQGLMEFRINYNFISFIVDNWGGPLPLKAKDVYDRFILARQELIENNIPLAINRALTFYNKTTENDLGLLDLVNICVIGLAVGIDKYSGAYTKVWRSVCIGRMVGFMIKEYSETFVKLYPADRKILYRANVMRYRHKIEDMVLLAKAVNDSFVEDKKKGMAVPKLPISADTIKNLMNSVHYISTDSKVNEDSESSDDGVGVYDYTADYEGAVDISEDAEKKDSLDQLGIAIRKLDMIPRKVIRLKGVLV